MSRWVWAWLVEAVLVVLDTLPTPPAEDPARAIGRLLSKLDDEDLVTLRACLRAMREHHSRTTTENAECPRSI
jgi:lauroyl/myristoyl acyltransferase